MPAESNFLSNFIFSLLGNSWDFFVNRNEINAYWDGELHKLGNLYLQAINTDAGKGLFTVPIEPSSERHLFIFNADTTTTSNFDVTYQAQSLTGTTKVTDGSIFEDAGALFITNAVQPGDRIVLASAIEFPTLSGNFVTELPIDSIISETEVSLTGLAAAGLVALDYTVVGITRFAFTIDEDIITIPQLEDSVIIQATARLFETTDYVVSDGVINFFEEPPEKMWAFSFKSNREQILNNFGQPVNFIRDNSLSYLFGTQGIWYALWNGPAVRRVGVGLQILFGLPFARDGVVTDVETFITGDSTVTVRDPTKGNFEIVSPLDSWLDPVVTTGEQLLPFSRLSNGIEVFDYINNPTVVDALVEPLRNRFHTWVIFALAEIIQNQVVISGELFDFDEVTDFVERFKPEYTDFIFGIDLTVEDLLLISTEELEVDLIVDVTSRTSLNYWNFLQYPPFLTENAPFTEAPGDPPTATPHPAEQVFHLDDENIGLLDELFLIEASDGITPILSI